MRIFDGQNEFVTTLKKALADIDPQWQTYPGVIVPGSHTPHLVEKKLAAIKKAREEGTPFLGVCLGHQLAAVDYARHILGIKDATSEEFGKGTFVVKKRKKGLKVGEHEGETYWSNYDVVIGWNKPANFFTAAFHPEYESSKEKPHYLLVKFLNYARTAPYRA